MFIKLTKTDNRSGALYVNINDVIAFYPYDESIYGPGTRATKSVVTTKNNSWEVKETVDEIAEKVAEILPMRMEAAPNAI